ncbi:hypothetical protein ACGF5F_16400 [Streptomyces sp. NPDC047821]|uniref:hypothetical protein n=1 Tax=Streptomyces sp. NPDC047821 TaxID=3365488 RepID=UPI003714BEF4
MNKISMPDAPADAANPPMRSRGRRLATALMALAALVLPMTSAAPAHAVTRKVDVYYGHENYEVHFIGTVKPKGPTGYTVEGELNGWCGAGAATAQSVNLRYAGSSKSWSHKAFWCDDMPQHLTFEGERKSGETVEFQVGATSQPFNLYGYGKKMVYDIGTS